MPTACFYSPKEEQKQEIHNHLLPQTPENDFKSFENFSIQWSLHSEKCLLFPETKPVMGQRMGHTHFLENCIQLFAEKQNKSSENHWFSELLWHFRPILIHSSFVYSVMLSIVVSGLSGDVAKLVAKHGVGRYKYPSFFKNVAFSRFCGKGAIRGSIFTEPFSAKDVCALLLCLSRLFPR